MSDNETPTTPRPSTPIDAAPGRERGPGAKPGAPPVGRAWSPEIIDLRGLESLAAPKPPPAVKVRVERHVSPLDSMTERQKMRLYIRVLCELVAYGESGTGEDPEPEPSLIA